MNSRQRLSNPRRRGTALAMALILVTVVAMLGAGFLQVSSALAKRQVNAVEQQLAFYVAEAGLAESFQAVRMGRSGKVGDETAPAIFGQGLVWVEVLELADGSIRLDSTGLHGTGRSTLSLVLEPVELDLGFFADEDLVIDSVLMTDGWNSDESSYAEAATDLPRVSIGPGEASHDNVELNVVWIGDWFYDYAYREGEYYYYADSVARDPILLTAEARAYFDGKGVKGDDDDDDDDRQTWGEGMDSANPLVAAAGAEGPPGITTGQGALLGSNGDVRFNLPAGEVAEVWGDVRPGPSGSITGLASASIDGLQGSRGTTVELPGVTVPDVTRSAAIRHDDLIPMLIPSGESGHARIEVAAGAELVIRGPATVVIGALVLEPGAHLELDTRAGDVTLFVTDEIDLQEGASVATSGDEPGATTVQVASDGANPIGPAVNLDATSRFYGTVYAPDSEVHIGTNFEVFGSVIARRLDIGEGARLHFDSTGVSGKNRPKIIGWRVIEVPAAAKGGGDPFRMFGVDPATAVALSEAHDLDNVEMTLDYIDLGGIERSYVGSEDQFNWDNVEEVVMVEREAERPKEVVSEEPATEEPAGEEPEPELAEPRAYIANALDTLADGTLKDYLIAKSPLTESELLTFIDDDKMAEMFEKDVLMASVPLPESVLTKLVRSPDGAYDPDLGQWLNADGLDKGTLVDVLVANSPLPQSTLDAVAGAGPGLLTDAHKVSILSAQ